MDFALSDEQLQLQAMVRDFAAREIAPHVRAWDESSHFPIDVIRQLGRLGLMGTIFPAEYGGPGLGYIEYVLAVEELSRVDGSVGIIVAAHTSLAANHIFVAGSEDQRRRYLPKLASGEQIGAWALTEPRSGSDAGAARRTAALTSVMRAVSAVGGPAGMVIVAAVAGLLLGATRDPGSRSWCRQ